MEDLEKGETRDQDNPLTGRGSSPDPQESVPHNAGGKDDANQDTAGQLERRKDNGDSNEYDEAQDPDLVRFNLPPQQDMDTNVLHRLPGTAPPTLPIPRNGLSSEDGWQRASSRSLHS